MPRKVQGVTLERAIAAVWARDYAPGGRRSTSEFWSIIGDVKRKVRQENDLEAADWTEFEDILWNLNARS